MPIHALVLAAGAGTRMGHPKATVRLGGNYLAQRAIDNVHAAGIEHCTVVLGAGADHAQSVLVNGTARQVVNTHWERGQTSSLKSGLVSLHAQAEAFLIYPVDFGLVRPADLNAMRTAWDKLTERHRVILRPVCGEVFGHPVLFSRDFAEEFLKLGEAEPANGIYKRNRESVQLVEVDHAGIGLDLDTPEDLAAAEQMLAEH